MDAYIISVLVFLISLVVIVVKNRKKIEIQGPVILYRTKRFIEIIDVVALKFNLLWKIIGTIGIFAGILFMVFGISYLVSSAALIATGAVKESTLKFVLPSPVPTTSVGYAHILIPFWTWVLTVFLIMTPHELFHGIMARIEKVRIKSVGPLLILIFPGAFVEPEEKQLKRKKLIQKLRIFCAGSFANIIVSFLAFFLGVFLWNYTQVSVVIDQVFPNSPAYNAGIKEGMTINAINGVELKNDFGLYSSFIFSKMPPERLTASVSLLYILTNGTFRNYSYKPGDNITLTLDGKNYTITLAQHPEDASKPYIGISTSLRDSSFLPVFYFLAFLSMISFAVGIVNMLPLYPLDGGQVIKAIFDKLFSKTTSKKLTKAISFATLFLLIYSFLGPWFINS